MGGSGAVGSGTGSEITISSGGTLSAGNSIGALTINGNLKLAAGSNIETEIAGDGRADLVNVTGTAGIAGSNLYVTTIDPETSYQDGKTYRVLTYDNGISGEFSTAVSRSAFLDFALAYNSNSVDLKIALNNGGIDPGKPEPNPLFTTVAGTSNQFATAAALDTLAQTGSSLALYNDLLMLTAEEARHGFDNLSGEAYASASGVLIDQSQFVRGVMGSRLQQAFGGAPAAPIEQLSFFAAPRRVSSEAIDYVSPSSLAPKQTPYTVWGNAYGTWGNQDGNGNTDDIKSSVGGFVSGIDSVVLDTWRIGVLAGYSHSSFHSNDRSSSGNSDNYTLGTYAGSQWVVSNNAALNLRSGLSYTWHNLSMNRSIAFPGMKDSLSSDYDASTLQLFGEVGYQVKMSRAVFEPYANLAFVRFKSDGFDEDGLTAAALSVNSATTNTSFSTLGLRASTDLQIGNTAVVARGDIGWRHAYGDVIPVSTASFVGSDAFNVSGTPIAKDVALIEAGFDVPLNEASKVGISYNGQFGSGAVQNGLNARFSVAF
ncbi:autotransporter outer membrane beta-barrel domain-containing protein [Brucella rhizosphaerae]|uniref:autotransporter family protein n=1 Tax=Brucella rhizosphaerae TaxID=571254 RepID=UPI0036213ADF